MDAEEARRVVVTDVRIPFWRVSMLLVQWTIAAVPAIAILALVLAGLWAVALNLIIRLSSDLPIAP